MLILVYLIAMIAGIVGMIAFGLHEGMAAGAIALRVIALVVGAQVVIVLAMAVAASLYRRTEPRPLPRQHVPSGRRNVRWDAKTSQSDRPAAQGRHS